jgi:hypothetical protein
VVALGVEGEATVEGLLLPPVGGRCAIKLALKAVRRGRAKRVLNRMRDLPDPCIVRPIERADCKKNVAPCIPKSAAGAHSMPWRKLDDRLYTLAFFGRQLGR